MKQRNLMARICAAPHIVWAVLFIVAPLIFVAYYAFTDQSGHFTFDNIGALSLHGETFLLSVCFSLIATVISTVLGTLAALALYRMKNKIYKGVYNALVYTPLVVPDILMGMSLLLLFVLIIKTFGTWFTALTGITIELGMTTIIIAHVTFCMSYVTMVVLGRLQEFDKSLIEAAEDLGASGLYTFFHVTLPVIMPGIIAGALFAFTLSIDDFVITFFVKGAGDTTLPIFIQSSIKHGRELPMLNALSVIFLILTFILVFVTQILLTNKPKEKK